MYNNYRPWTSPTQFTAGGDWPLGTSIPLSPNPTKGSVPWLHHNLREAPSSPTTHQVPAPSHLPRFVDSHLGHDTQYRPHTKPGITFPCPVALTRFLSSTTAPRASKPSLPRANSQSYCVDFQDAPSLRHLDSASDIVHLSFTPASNSSSSSRCHQAVQTWRRDCAILVGMASSPGGGVRPSS